MQRRNHILFTVVLTILFITISVRASAQYYYSEYTPPCEDRGTMTHWDIKYFRASLFKDDKTVKCRSGQVTISASCVNVECYHYNGNFEITEMERKSPTQFKLRLSCRYSDNDIYYDYLEVRPALGTDKSLSLILLGNKDSEGKIYNTMQITCKKLNVKTK